MLALLPLHLIHVFNPSTSNILLKPFSTSTFQSCINIVESCSGHPGVIGSFFKVRNYSNGEIVSSPPNLLLRYLISFLFVHNPPLLPLLFMSDFAKFSIL